MFDVLEALPADPILGLSVAYKADENPSKVDLGAGVYKIDSGITPIMAAVKRAEQSWFETEDTKVYIGPPGAPGFNQAMREILFGADHSVIADSRIASAQSPGGSGALCVAAFFAKRCTPDATVWISDPSWSNHFQLIGTAGLKTASYPYYDHDAKSIDFDGMIAALRGANAGDLVLLHGCCHNPSGADLTDEQWHAIADLAEEIGFVPFLDTAYQGLGRGLDEDAYGIRHLAERLPEMLIAASCSKNFGLYRERVGLIAVVAKDAETAATVKSQLDNVIRCLYSMPPSHGAAIVDLIWHDDSLRNEWLTELAEMRVRIQELRSGLVAALAAQGVNRDFSFIERESGMFSFLGITKEQVARLRDEYSIYMVGSSRINVAGLNAANMDYVAGAIADVLRSEG